MNVVHFTFGSRLQELHHFDQILLFDAPCGSCDFHLMLIIANLLHQVAVGFIAQVMLMDSLDATFKAERDQQSDRYRQQMQQKVLKPCIFSCGG